MNQNEKEWLNYRKGRTFCRYCDKVSLCANPYSWGAVCPIDDKPNYKDAAEFEARVAVRLAGLFSASTGTPGCPGCPCVDDCYSGHLKCEEAILKYARLEVEEEMDNDDNQ